MPSRRPAGSRVRAFECGFVMAMLLFTRPMLAQSPSVVHGAVTSATEHVAIAGVHVRVSGTARTTLTDRRGQYRLAVDPGPVTLEFSAIGFQAVQRDLAAAGADATINIEMSTVRVVLQPMVIVTTASRAAERVVDAPAAVSVVDPVRARDAAVTAQLPQLLASLPGVLASQNGVNDYNVSTRGFNSFLTRRILVLQDGRDLSVPTLSSQEWSALSMPLDALGRIELVRGPGSALYGANAYSGVLNIITPAPRDAPGSRLSIGAGELGTFRADAQHAGTSADARFGWRANIGYSRSDSWDRPRTELGALAREYAGAIDTASHRVIPPIPGYEVRALNGQTKKGAALLPGATSGTADPLSSTYGSARLDYYLSDGSTLTAEGGTSEVHNQVFVTGAGRSQISDASRPWARFGWTADAFSVMAYYSGRESGEQWSLASGVPLSDRDDTWHLEAQINRPFAADKGTWVLGASARSTSINSHGTFIAKADDDRIDHYTAVFGQAEYAFSKQLKFVAAARYDASDLYDAQFSPKAALVWSPSRDQSVRLTWNRAFQTPNPVERFFGQPAGAPLDFSLLEAGMRASPLGPALAGVPGGQLFGVSSAVPLLALGNRNLRVETVQGYEVGYKGLLGHRGVIAVDLYVSQMNDFVTNLLPGANPAYGAWTAPAAVPAAARAGLEGAVRGAVGAGLTRLADGSTAFVVSLGNAGRANEWGTDIAAGYQLTDALTVEATYSYFNAKVDASSVVPGDSILPNSPSNMGNVSLTYRRSGGTDLTLSTRLVEAFAWRGGIFSGRVPARQVVDLTAGRDLNAHTRLQIAATNLLDQRRYEVFGGSVVGRRLLGSVSLRF